MRFASLNSWVLAAGRKAPAVPSLISWTDRTHTLLKRPIREQAVEVPEPGIESQAARSTRSSCREHGSLGVLEPVRESNGSGAAAPTSGRGCTNEILQLSGPGFSRVLGLRKPIALVNRMARGLCNVFPGLAPRSKLGHLLLAFLCIQSVRKNSITLDGMCPSIQIRTLF